MHLSKLHSFYKALNLFHSKEKLRRITYKILYFRILKTIAMRIKRIWYQAFDLLSSEETIIPGLPLLPLLFWNVGTIVIGFGVPTGGAGWDVTNDVIGDVMDDAIVSTLGEPIREKVEELGRLGWIPPMSPRSGAKGLIGLGWRRGRSGKEIPRVWLRARPGRQEGIGGSVGTEEGRGGKLLPWSPRVCWFGCPRGGLNNLKK